MATIDELMEGKAPGSVKVTNVKPGDMWGDDEYFIPYFKVSNTWYGKSSAGNYMTQGDQDVYGLYKEPKKMKTWYWCYHTMFSGLPTISALFKTEKEVRDRYGSDMLKPIFTVELEE